MTKKILIIGPAWVGDMVMAQCLFKLLRENDLNVKIDVLAPAWSMPLLARMPEVNQALVLPFQHGQLALKERYLLGKNLRERKYDQAIVLPNSFKSALVPFYAHIPKRTGFRGEMRYFLLNDVRLLNKKQYPLMIERFLSLGLKENAPLPTNYPVPELFVSTDTQKRALLNHQLDLSTKPILAICPGAEFGPAKRWPYEYYAEIANVKLNEGWDVFIFGSPKDEEVALKIMQQTNDRCINLTGKTSLEEAIDLLALATIVVSNDSGLMHIAAALKKPLIAIYGPTSASFTPPLHQKAKIVNLTLNCQPCFQRTCPLQHQRCMRDLKPSHILQLLKDGF